jgi:hypothetical protein
LKKKNEIMRKIEKRVLVFDNKRVIDRFKRIIDDKNCKKNKYK